MGAKTYELIDRDVRAHQDTGTKIQNGVSIAIGLLISVGSSWLIWRETSRALDLHVTDYEEDTEDPRMDDEHARFVLDDREL